MKILITGVAGFIGYHLANKLASVSDNEVVGIDNINSYYDTNLKKERLKLLKFKNIDCFKVDIFDKKKLENIFKDFRPDHVYHLAAQAGVRFSIENPYQYIESNLVGFFNILECCKLYNSKKLFFASSSSIYGRNLNDKFKENDFSDYPLNLYAASKKSNELMAYSYSNLFKLKCIGLRFFTVYGPFGRPDMMYFKFTKNIIENKKIQIFGNGEMWRDFTYIDDIVDGIVRLSRVNDNKIFNSNDVPFNIFNIGNNKPEKLNNFVKILEKTLNKKSKKVYLEIQLGDVYKTSADIKKIQSLTGFNPTTNLTVGIGKFVKWYKDFYK